jgi:hypothetical protein
MVACMIHSEFAVSDDLPKGRYTPKGALTWPSGNINLSTLNSPLRVLELRARRAGAS